ncbi:hypothetical protein PPN31114_03533 [Pandoraea pneumonica]|uniref:ParB/Sulfiredoxin domain-containing protein n=1 Tax=Pandoraea pneumonica TaxID=2508299 RepID=A0A5E4WY40_9BURK|nr:transcriptional regulator [Pandoraea pneumonica]VVE28614.1 hypothetical protein PPN31114_03533 [Pandoraea pneumonica]
MIDSRQTDLAAEPIITGNTKAAVKEAGGGSSDLWIIDPRKVFHDPRDNARPLDYERVAHLTALMLANGFDKTKPIGCFVRKVGDENRIYVHDGQHRHFAAIAAMDSGKWSRPEIVFDRVPLIIRDARTVDRRTLIITGITANDGERLTPLELGGRIAELQREGMTQAEICAALNITGQTVRDVMLLLDAPTELHTLIRDKAITSTLAIKTIRDVGPSKALGVIEKALSVATEQGRTKVTQKNLDLPNKPNEKSSPKPAAEKTKGTSAIGDAFAKQLLFATVAAYSSPTFGEDSPGFVEISTVLSTFCRIHSTTDDEAPVAVAHEYGMLDSRATEFIRSPKWAGSYVEINVARGESGKWYSSRSYQIGTTYQGGPVSHHGTGHSTRRLAIAAGAVALADQLRHNQFTRDNKHTHRAVNWLEELAVRALTGAV